MERWNAMESLYWLLGVVLVFVSLAPLGYGLMTLLGLRHKMVYPLIRFKKTNRIHDPVS